MPKDESKPDERNPQLPRLARPPRGRPRPALQALHARRRRGFRPRCWSTCPDVPMAADAICADLDHNVFNPSHTDPRVGGRAAGHVLVSALRVDAARASAVGASRRTIVRGQGIRRRPGGRGAVRRSRARRARSRSPTRRADRQAVYGSTDDDPDRHFLGWLDEVDPDALFASGEAWGITVVRQRDA